MSAVQKLTPDLATSMRDACEKRAEDFGLEKFEEQLKSYI